MAYDGEDGSFLPFAEYCRTVDHVIEQSQLEVSLYRPLLLQVVVSHQDLDYQDLYIDQGKLLPNATSGPSTEDQAHNMLVLGFFPLPPLGIELQWLCKDGRVVHEVDEVAVDKSSFLDPNPPNSQVFNDLSLEHARR